MVAEQAPGRGGVRCGESFCPIDYRCVSVPEGSLCVAPDHLGTCGNGVPEEALEKIFRPFYRTEDARDRQSGGGTGLGLAITERAVRMHGGSVQATNAPGGGLSVEMKLLLTGKVNNNGHTGLL